MEGTIIMKRIPWLLFVLALFIFRTTDIFGYGYGTRGKDTLVAVHENIVGFIEENNYEAIKMEAEKIEVPLSNYLKYYNIDLRQGFVQAIEQKDAGALIKSMEQLIYFAVREKIYWNNKEKLEKNVAANAGLKVILQYYMLLKPKIEKYDKENSTSLNSETTNLIMGMKKTLGSPGTFGYDAKPPDFEEFRKLSSHLEEVLVTIFPHFADGHKAIINAH